MGVDWVYLIVQIIIYIVVAVIAHALQPKPPTPPGMEAPTLGDMQVPTADKGRPIPVAFGTVLVKAPNVIWYGDFKYVVIMSDGSIGGDEQPPPPAAPVTPTYYAGAK